MRLDEFKNFKVKNVGREYNHLEDLIFIEGNAGISKIIKIIENIQSNNDKLSIKWDGNPTVFWGRDQQGNFVLTGKNGWGKHKPESKESLREFVLNTGKGEDWRQNFAAILVNAYEILEQNTPNDLRGYFYGDLLWHEQNPFSLNENTVSFMPNKVTYVVEQHDLKQKIQKSKLGVAIHKFYEDFGSKQGSMVTDSDFLNTHDVLTFSQEFVEGTVNIDKKLISEFSEWQKRYGYLIDDFLQERKGLSDLRNIIYTYVNQTVKNKNLENLSTGFYEWLNNSKVSNNKKIKITDLDQSYGGLIETILEGVIKVMNLKNSIIEQLDKQQCLVKCMIAEDAGGEGYVSVSASVKLVPRHHWKPN